MLRTFLLTFLGGVALVALVLALKPEDQSAAGAEQKPGLGSAQKGDHPSGTKSTGCTGCDFPSP
ncbi:MAG: hypothetical protein HYS12_13935 [Planctomycetes bacterium]|nr:hypothetical protein [Planctomycetota bacterium]